MPVRLRQEIQALPRRAGRLVARAFGACLLTGGHDGALPRLGARFGGLPRGAICGNMTECGAFVYPRPRRRRGRAMARCPDTGLCQSRGTSTSNRAHVDEPRHPALPSPGSTTSRIRCGRSPTWPARRRRRAVCPGRAQREPGTHDNAAAIGATPLHPAGRVVLDSGLAFGAPERRASETCARPQPRADEPPVSLFGRRRPSLRPDLPAGRRAQPRSSMAADGSNRRRDGRGHA